VDPGHYGGRRHETIYGIDPERDDTEIRLSRDAAATGLPSLCICRGVQVLNVALGGTLIEHLPDEVGEKVLHRARPKGHVPHPVELVSGSKLAEMLGAAPAAPSSSHHQAIRELAPDLRVAARAHDGTIEAVEHRTHRWLFGVQWHPEVSAATDPVEQRFFDELVRTARESRRR
jgi:putative glutamine amidotransferase